MNAETVPVLHICVSCRAGLPLGLGEVPLGAQLHAAIGKHAGAAVRLREVLCLANCARGCSAAISAAGKWTYLLGGLRPGQAADLLAYAESYAASPNGTVLPSRRPQSLRDAVLGRIPPSEGLL